MLRTILSITVIPLLLLVITTGFAYSGSYELTTDKEAFLAEYPNLMRQDFSGANVAPGNTKACPGPVNSSTNNDCFSPGIILPGIELTNGLVPENSMRLAGANFPGFGNEYTALIANNSEIFNARFLNQDYNVVGLLIGCTDKGLSPCSETLVVEIFGFGEATIGSTTVEATSAFDSFLGISSSEPIQRIVIVPEVQDENSFPGVSVVYFGQRARNIPTLSEWGLIAMAGAIGIIGLFYMKRQAAA